MAPASSPPSRRRRRITRIVAAAWLLVGIGSCTSVLDLDGHASVAEEMCTLLDRCYDADDSARCRPTIEGHLNEASSPVRAQWLKSITDRSCLDSCSAGRVCLNLEPLCTFAGSCVLDQDCCGSLEGRASCVDGSCCTTRGSACNSDADCCTGAGACVNGTCGGTTCTEANQRCERDVDCCTRICKGNQCATTVCNDNKFDCVVDQDCCSGFCDPAVKRCAEPPTCGGEGEACAIETDCCSETHCVRAPGTLEGHCAARACSLELVDCADDDQCCSGHCDRSSSSFFCAVACSHAGNSCAADTDCCASTCTDNVCVGTCSTNLCTKSAGCCNGNPCVGGVCGAECAPPAAHNPCTPGGPLATVDIATACVDVICAADPFCCCVAWDDICVNAAFLPGSTCSGSCL